MKKTNIIKTILGVIAITLMYSCEDRIELNPEDSLTTDVVFSSKFAVQGAVTGLYGQAREVDMLNGNSYVYQGLMTDELDWTGSFASLINIYDYETKSTNGSVDEFWREGYEMVNQANFVIKKVPGLDFLKQSEKDSYIGQAKFMRAIAYFQMLNLYAQPYQVNNGGELGLPIITEPFDSKANSVDFQKPRATVDEVQKFILNDLKDAITILPTDISNSLASKDAAKALKSRLHLYREEWKEAGDLANEVINSSFKLATDYKFWDTFDKENIFTIANDATNGPFGGTGIVSFALPVPDGRGDAFLTKNLIDSFESGDLRFSENTKEGKNTDGDIKTFSTKVIATNGSTNIPVIRISEMYYIRAEANLKGGLNISGVTPLKDINTLRKRAGLSDLTSVDIDVILDERRKEFFLEGHRRMDLLRNRKNLRPVGNAQYEAAKFQQPKTIFPIPPRELENNPAMKQQQNPSY